MVVWGRDFGGSGKAKSRAFGVSSPGIFEAQQRASVAVAERGGGGQTGEVTGQRDGGWQRRLRLPKGHCHGFGFFPVWGHWRV